MFGRVLLAGAVAVVALPAATASAATTYTVDATAAAGCNTSNVCKTIADANKAVASGDTIVVNPGTYTETGATIDVTKTNVTLKAAQPGKATVTTAGMAAAPVLQLAAGDVVDGLVITVPQNAGAAVSVNGAGTTVRNTFLSRTAANVSNTAVYSVAAGVTGTNTLASSILLQSPQTAATGVAPPAVAGNATSSMTMTADTVISGAAQGPALALSGAGTANNAAVANTITDTQLLVANPASSGMTIATPALSSPNVNVSLDSVVVNGGANASGIVGATTPTGGPIAITGKHVTIAGTGAPLDLTGTGALLTAAPSITATFDASIIHGTKDSHVATSGLALTPGTAKLTMTNSDVTDSGKTGSNVSFSGSAKSDDNKIFVNLAALDFHERVGAPTIDQGGPVASGAATTDIDGQPRLNGPATDRGADEFVDAPPVGAIAVSTTTPKTGQPVTFDASRSVDQDAAKGGAVTGYTWSFGDGTTVSTVAPTTTHVYTKPGPVVARVVPVDNSSSFGSPASAALNVVAANPPTISISTPKSNQKIHLFSTSKKTHKKTQRTVTFKGSSSDASGISKVEIALRRVKTAKTPKKKSSKKKSSSSSKKKAKATTRASSCTFSTSKSTFKTAPCASPPFFSVTQKNGAWSYKTKKSSSLKAGVYQLQARATANSGSVSKVTTKTFTFLG